jgi:hypothetical protein
MAGMAGGRERLEPERGFPDDMDVLLRDRCQLAPKVERVAVEAAGRAFELGRVDQVRGADLCYMDLELRVAPDEDAGGAGMVEVDVAEQEVPDVRERQAALFEPSLERGDAARGPAVEEREAVVGLEEVAPDDVLGALVVEVD